MKLLFDASQIREGTERVAARIREAFAGEELIVLAVLRGGIVFAADLIRALGVPVRLDAVSVRSYRGRATTSDSPRITSAPALELAGQCVLVVDDILDTGWTLSCIRDEVLRRGARRVATAVLLEKSSRRQAAIEPDFVVFTVENVWVVGYGLDHDERFRHLPYIAALEEEDVASPPGPN